MIKNIGISGTPEEIKIIDTLLKLEGFEQHFGLTEGNSLVTYIGSEKSSKKFAIRHDVLSFGMQDKKIFKASEFDQAYQYLFDKELFSTEYFKTCYKKLAIQCNSQEEYDNILKVYSLKNFKKNYYPIYKTNTCINIGDSAYCNLEYYLEHEYKVIPASFVLQFKSEKMKKVKKIIGYNLKDNLHIDDTKQEFLKGIATMGCIWSQLSHPTVEEINKAMSNPNVQRHFIAAKVIDLWFTPVYEQDEVVLNIGNPKQRVLINSNGITCDGKTMNFEELEQIYHKNRYIGNSTKTGWVIEFSEIKIGCSKFSIEEFGQVIEASKKFKS